eukprot:g3916.t1
MTSKEEEMPAAKIMRGENSDVVMKQRMTKIALFNAPRNWDKKRLRKFVEEKNFEDVASVRKVPNKSLGFVGFKTEEAMRKGLEMFRSIRVPGSTSTKKRKYEDDDEFFRCDVSRPPKSVAPLYNVPYEKQIEQKFLVSKKNVTTITRRLRKKFAKRCKKDKTVHWKGFAACRDKSFDDLCPTEDVKTCEKVNGYRNKCTFSFGRDKDGNICTGFRIGSFEDTLKIDSPKDCPNIAEVSKLVARLATDFVKTSKLELYEAISKKGFWYQVTTRHSERTNEMLILLMVKPTEEKDLAKSEMERFCKFMQDAKEMQSSSIKLVSIWVSTFDGIGNVVNNQNVETVHLWGKKCIQEKLLGRTFEISPLSFFQVNTLGAEVLYSIVRNCVQDSKKKRKENENEITIVLDICCGTGTIGICMSDIADLVIGVEICEPAVEDAKRNAELNKVDNTLFVCRAAEKELRSLLQNEKRIRHVAKSVMPKLFEKDENRPIRVIAVVDPPRNGLHSRALRALRKYLCRPELLNQKDRDYIKGPHFNLTHAYPVDMFPHTKHCEMVMVFERGGDEVKDDATTATTTTGGGGEK